MHFLLDGLTSEQILFENTWMMPGRVTAGDRQTEGLTEHQTSV